MKVLIACEFSGIVRRAFREAGHIAYSCDLLPAEDGSLYHYEADVRCVLEDPRLGEGWWDLMIAHPPCTYLASSGARWFASPERQKAQEDAVDFVRYLLDAPIHRICIENPVGVLSTRIRKPDQIIQPWMFGHGETKATCLWLKNLPILLPMYEVTPGRDARVHKEPPSPDRWKNRSRTLPGIAEAMADQWGTLWTHEQ